jgi:Ca2+-binding RTX toxin-like protein
VGGLGNDTMTGNWGEDLLFGGDGQDRLGAGSDNDQVFGGSGNDTVIGFDGDDLLNDGSGADLLNGGIGADTFVLVTDGASDRIVDFENGIDRIDLTDSFASLTITTLAAGRVQILHSGEVLLVEDLARQLTAADLTAADFI